MDNTNIIETFLNAEQIPYNWPNNCCVSLIKQLATDRVDYSYWERMTELECLQIIQNKSGDVFENYVKMHQHAFKNAFEIIPNDSEPELGDVVFCKLANGHQWISNPKFPATMFYNGDDFYAFAPSNKNHFSKVISYKNKLMHIRRKT